MARPTHHPFRTARRERATQRQAAYDELSLDEKIARATPKGGKVHQKLMERKRKRLDKK